MALLRAIQKDTGGFTEFVPLSLIHSEAPMYSKGLVPGVRPGATGVEVVRMHALARLMLGRDLPQHPGLVGEGGTEAGPAACSTAGANDLGGTLINESISTSAGAQYGQLVPPAELRRLIRDAGRDSRRSATRSTASFAPIATVTIQTRPSIPIDDAEARFGSYRRLDRVGRVSLHARVAARDGLW